MKNCYIFSNCSIYDNSVITYSVIGDNCILKKNCKVTDSCVLGMGVVLNEKVNLQDVTVKSQPPDFCEFKDFLLKFVTQSKLQPIQNVKSTIKHTEWNLKKILITKMN